MAAPKIPYPSFNDVLFKIQENVDGDPAILRSTAAKALELVDEKKVLLSPNESVVTVWPLQRQLEAERIFLDW